MTTARIQALLARACLDVDRPDVAALLAAHEIDPEDAAALRAAERRLGLYRRLVRHNVTDVVDTMLEGTRARLERHAPGELDRTVAAFLAEVGPRTAHLRDVPAEVLAFAMPRWRADARLPRWIGDYAALELADFTIACAPRPGPAPRLADVTAERPLVFAEPKQMLRLGWAVNVLPREDLGAVPEERAVAILVYRDAEHASRFLELTPLAAAILEELFDGTPLGPALAAACAKEGHALDDIVLGGAARLLADLGERGVLLGAVDA